MIPDPALVVLVGPAGSGKSFWATEHHRRGSIVSSDALRDAVGTGPADLDASADAFAVLDVIVAARLKRRSTCVIDTLGLDAVRRQGYLSAARAAGLPAVAVVLRTPLTLCRTRNAARDRPVPAPVLAEQHRKTRAIDAEIDGEGWDLVVRLDSDEPIVAPASTDTQAPVRDLDFVLQVSSFPWGPDPVGWLTSIALAAEEAGFTGLALMDHLIQIPQVGRAWDPIPEPMVTLGLLAAVTTTLRLGTLVSPISFRAPGLVAKSIATLDALSGGRAWCGLGMGWWEREHAAFGVGFTPVAQRARALAAGIETIRALWGTGTKPYRSDRVDLPETTCYPRPVSRIPIVVGGSGEKRTLAVVAELADAANLSSDPVTLDRKIAVLREHCRRLDRDPATVQISVLDLPVVGENADHTATLVERLRGRTAASTYARQHHAGLATAHIQRYRELADRGVRTVYASLPDLAGPSEVRRFAPITAAFA